MSEITKQNDPASRYAHQVLGQVLCKETGNTIDDLLFKFVRQAWLDGFDEGKTKNFKDLNETDPEREKCPLCDK